MRVGIVQDHIAHLGYDRAAAAARLRRGAQGADLIRRMRTARPVRIPPRIKYVPIKAQELPAFVLERARDKGLDLAS